MFSGNYAKDLKKHSHGFPKSFSCGLIEKAYPCGKPWKTRLKFMLFKTIWQSCRMRKTG